MAANQCVKNLEDCIKELDEPGLVKVLDMVQGKLLEWQQGLTRVKGAEGEARKNAAQGRKLDEALAEHGMSRGAHKRRKKSTKRKKSNLTKPL